MFSAQDLKGSVLIRRDFVQLHLKLAFLRHRVLPLDRSFQETVFLASGMVIQVPMGAVIAVLAKVAPLAFRAGSGSVKVFRLPLVTTLLAGYLVGIRTGFWSFAGVLKLEHKARQVT
jgi:hypothetical protein